MKTTANIKKTISFTAIFIVLYVVIGYLLILGYQHKGFLLISDLPIEKPGIHKIAFKNFNRQAKYDLIFLGSSHCYRCFDPRIFNDYGLKAYNLGSSSQSPLNSYSIIKKLIPHTKHIILEVYPVTINTSGKESYLDLYKDIADYKMLLDMAWNLNDISCFNLLFLKPMLDYSNRNYVVAQDNFYDGYVETDMPRRGNVKYKTYVIQPEIADKQFRYLNMIIKLCKKNNIRLDLVYAPVPRELVIKNEDYVINNISKIAMAGDINFYNMGRNHELDSKEHFFDDDHLNQKGVTIFNTLLIRQILNL